MLDSQPEIPSIPLDSQTLKRNMIFVGGKGGVGKTVISQALAATLAKKGLKTLWATFADPTLPRGEMMSLRTHLTHLNCDPTLAFEEYATLKIGEGKVAQFFIKNRLMRYLAEAAPGFHELVLLGKVWFERKNFDVVVCDMPSTGYGLTMFQATQNFSELFAHSPIQNDADAMTRTFASPQESLHLVVALPEEMPLQEGKELGEMLYKIFPKNPAAYLVNRAFPAPLENLPSQESQESTDSPITFSATEYVEQRVQLERQNLRIWENAKLIFSKVPYLPPQVDLQGGLSVILEEFLR